MEQPITNTTSNIFDWSLTDTKNWLKELGFDNYLISKFNENNITGEILPYLKNEHFQEMELALPDRIKLKIEINKLLDEEGYIYPNDIKQLKTILININDIIVSNVEASNRFINDELYKLKDDLSRFQKPLPTPEKNPPSPSPFNLTSPNKSSKFSTSSPNDYRLSLHRKSSDFKSKSQRNSDIVPNSTQSPTNSHSISTIVPSLKSVSEPLKQLRASTDDPCSKILQAAMKRHKLNDNWRNYALVICYGDRERILELDEKPVQIFKELKEKGEHPAIMLRQKSDHVETRGAPGGKL